MPQPIPNSKLCNQALQSGSAGISLLSHACAKLPAPATRNGKNRLTETPPTNFVSRSRFALRPHETLHHLQIKI